MRDRSLLSVNTAAIRLFLVWLALSRVRGWDGLVVPVLILLLLVILLLLDSSTIVLAVVVVVVEAVVVIVVAPIHRHNSTSGQHCAAAVPSALALSLALAP